MNVYISGCWDLLHEGHLNILERAKALGGNLIVGVNTDELLESYKGREAVMPYKQRTRLVAALRCVDKVIPHVALDEVEMLETYHINIVAVASDYGKLPGMKKRISYIRKTGRKLVVFPYTEGISTERIIQRIRGAIG